jgi:hypothetical protein
MERPEVRGNKSLLLEHFGLSLDSSPLNQARNDRELRFFLPARDWCAMTKFPMGAGRRARLNRLQNKSLGGDFGNASQRIVIHSMGLGTKRDSSLRSE